MLYVYYRLSCNIYNNDFDTFIIILHVECDAVTCGILLFLSQTRSQPSYHDNIQVIMGLLTTNILFIRVLLKTNDFTIHLRQVSGQDVIRS